MKTTVPTRAMITTCSPTARDVTPGFKHGTVYKKPRSEEKMTAVRGPEEENCVGSVGGRAGEERRGEETGFAWALRVMTRAGSNGVLIGAGGATTRRWDHRAGRAYGDRRWTQSEARARTVFMVDMAPARKAETGPMGRGPACGRGDEICQSWAGVGSRNSAQTRRRYT